MMLHVMQRSPGSVLTWFAGVLIGMQGGAICAQETVTPPVAEPTPDAGVDKPASPTTKPARTPTTRATSTRSAAKPGVPAADEVKAAQKFRLTRTGKLDPKSPLGIAVEEIRREYERGALRNDSSYFREMPCNDLTTDNLFILLDRRLDATPAVDGYIKWQLLSSLPKSLAAQYKPLVIAALNKAPVPNMTAGVIADDAQRQQLERAVARFNEQQAKAEMEKLDSERERVHTLNQPILAYRSALAELLDESYDGVMAAFADAYHRGQAGAEYNSALDRATRLANGWLKTNPPRDKLQRFTDALAEIRDVKLTDVITQFQWNEQSRVFELRRDQRNLDAGGRIRTLEQDMKQRLDTPQDDGQDNQPRGRRRGR